MGGTEKMEKTKFERTDYRHYVSVGANGDVTGAWSSGASWAREPGDGDVCISEEGSYQFRFAPGGEPNPPLRHGAHPEVFLYRHGEGGVSAKSGKEIAAEIAALPEPEPEPDIWDAILELAEKAGVELEPVPAGIRERRAEPAGG
jgi:hypothetical protein